MRFIFNNDTLIHRRRELRHHQTKAEFLLWQKLRRRNLLGFRFCRQYGIGAYVLDFYCPSQRLGIEVDGSQHLEKSQETYDMIRTKFFEDYNIRILRFWNNEINENMNGVLQKIIESLGRNPSLPSP